MWTDWGFLRRHVLVPQAGVLYFYPVFRIRIHITATFWASRIRTVMLWIRSTAFFQKMLSNPPCVSGAGVEPRTAQLTCKCSVCIAKVHLIRQHPPPPSPPVIELSLIFLKLPLWTNVCVADLYRNAVQIRLSTFMRNRLRLQRTLQRRMKSPQIYLIAKFAAETQIMHRVFCNRLLAVLRIRIRESDYRICLDADQIFCTGPASRALDPDPSVPYPDWRDLL